MSLNFNTKNVYVWLEQQDDNSCRSILEGVMLNDTKLWKSARQTWHHVLIAGMLKDYDLKKRFATVSFLKFFIHSAGVLKNQ